MTLISNDMALDLYYIDNGEHAWLEVHHGVAWMASDTKAMQSPYSYYDPRERVYYFEEDVDGPEVIAALKAQGVKVNVRDMYKENWRPPYNPLG